MWGLYQCNPIVTGVNNLDFFYISKGSWSLSSITHTEGSDLTEAVVNKILSDRQVRKQREGYVHGWLSMSVTVGVTSGRESILC